MVMCGQRQSPEYKKKEIKSIDKYWQDLVTPSLKLQRRFPPVHEHDMVFLSIGTSSIWTQEKKHWVEDIKSRLNGTLETFKEISPFSHDSVT